MNKEKKHLNDLPEGLKAINKIKIKNIKTGVGHDLMGYYCDFYIGNKKIGYANDDGWGGEVEIRYETVEGEKQMKQICEEHDIAKLLFEECGWEFMKDVKEINIYTQVQMLIEDALNYQAIQKNNKKYTNARKKATLKSIVYGTEAGYKSSGYKILLKELIEKYPQGRFKIQEKYDEVKKKLKKGEKIFNDNLEELGIKL